MNSWEIVGWVLTHHKLIPTNVQSSRTFASQTPVALTVSKGCTERWGLLAAASFRPLGELLFVPPKSNQKARPGTPLVSCGARNGRDQNKSPDGALPRAVGSWFWSTTARCSAPRRGLTGRSRQHLIASRLGYGNPMRASGLRRRGTMWWEGLIADEELNCEF